MTLAHGSFYSADNRHYVKSKSEPEEEWTIGPLPSSGGASRHWLASSTSGILRGVKEDLRIPPGPGLPRGQVISASDLAERFSRSSGPGGQGVNTTDSRVQLSLDIATAAGFTPEQRERLLARLATRLDGTVLTVEASEHRSQRRNRAAARERLASLVGEALAPPPPRRRPTRRTRGSQQRRLAAKRRRGETKAARARPPRDD